MLRNGERVPASPGGLSARVSKRFARGPRFGAACRLFHQGFSFQKRFSALRTVRLYQDDGAFLLIFCLFRCKPLSLTLDPSDMLLRPFGCNSDTCSNDCAASIIPASTILWHLAPLAVLLSMPPGVRRRSAPDHIGASGWSQGAATCGCFPGRAAAGSGAL